MFIKLYTHILFDLDGTITDPAEGITNSIIYSLRRFGIEESDRKKLYAFIGPPLYASYEKYYGFSHEQAVKAVDVYREYYADRGIFECYLYDGMAELLRELSESAKIILATSKPTVFATRILEHFGIGGRFDFVAGSELDGGRIEKGDVIAYAARSRGFAPEKALMVGDRKHDIIGAAANGMDAVGVLYGYGSRAELEGAGAKSIADDVGGLHSLLAGLVSKCE